LARRRAAQDGTAEKSDYRVNTSLARGLQVLRCFGPDNRPLGNADIAARVDLPKPTVSRFTFTLTELGYLEYHEETGRYTLGAGVLALGYDVLAQMEMRDLARPYMQKLADLSGASVFLGVLTGLEMTYVEGCRSPSTTTISLGVGSRVPLATTGMGRAFLGALPEEERETLIVAVAPQYGTDWPRVEASMRAAIAVGRQRGFTMALGDWIAEANSAGATICRPDGRPVYALNIGGLRSIITKERLEANLGPRLVEMARQIEYVARERL